MKAAGLKAIDTVMESTAVLVKSRGTKNELVELIASRIRGVISMFFFFTNHPEKNCSQGANISFTAAQRYVLCQYNIPRTELATASKITPGKRAPTVTALEDDGWVAVSSMVEKKSIATVMDQLTEVGATDILVMNIANSRTA